MGMACRNHPCVARYSLANEVREPILGKRQNRENWPWRPAIDDMMAVDDTRPLVFELHQQGQGRVDGIKSGHAFIMNHYTDIQEKVGPDRGIRGMGEHFWNKNSMGEFAVGMRTLRVNDWCYMGGWCWLNYWPNFLEGMSHATHAWTQQNHSDRQDGKDGWGSPIVRFTQQSLHPYLLQDRGLLADNPKEPQGIKRNEAQWPYNLPTIISGAPVERNIEVFNGGLTGNTLTLCWSAHWDKPDGPLAIEGGEIPCDIEPGFHATKTISFTAPKVEPDGRILYLVMESRRDGKTLFREEATCFKVTRNF
jgi:hypothetical protein